MWKETGIKYKEMKLNEKSQIHWLLNARIKLIAQFTKIILNYTINSIAVPNQACKWWLDLLEAAKWIELRD